LAEEQAEQLDGRGDAHMDSKYISDQRSDIFFGTFYSRDLSI
jgi:hypothetical protein